MARRDALLRLHKSLMARRNDLIRKLSRDLADLRGLGATGTTGDAADVAFDAGSDEMASQLAELEARELAQIERALIKLKKGTYGCCEGCGEKIAVARLNALPYTAYCIDCQREAEQNPNWEPHGHASWEKAVEVEGRLDERPLRLSDIELDLSGR